METQHAEYFTSYEDLEVHKLMIEDEPRTKAYMDAIFNNKNYFADKVVMDVGCGTGILSIFCAQAGAKKVYAVEASNLAELAKEVVKENNLENVIEVIHSKVEDVTLPDNIKVDAIISEWMGFFLLHEGMLDSVLTARDKFLKEDGHMFPESATIYIAPCSLPTLNENWEEIHGISMLSFAKHLRISKQTKPEIMTIEQDDLIGDEVALCQINLKTDTVSSLDSYTIQHVSASTRDGLFQGLCVWFDCVFPNLSDDENACPVKLDTGPKSSPTHWKQAVIVMPEEQEMDDQEPLAFQMDMKRDQIHPRRYNLEVTMLDPSKVAHPYPCDCYSTTCLIVRAFLDQNTWNAFKMDDDDEEENKDKEKDT